MAVSLEPEERQSIVDALSEWRGDQGIRWANRATDYLDTLGLSATEAGRRMCEHVRAGGRIFKVEEKRERWKGEHTYHYDLVLDLGGDDPSYIEMRLMSDSRVNPPYLWVVSAHRSNP